MTSKSRASSCCPSVGSSNGRSAGSTEPDASPKTSKRQSSPRSHGSSSPSPSCSRDASPGSQVNKRDFRVGLSEVWYISPDATVFDAIAKMSEKDVGSLAVMDGDELVGVITERHYARNVFLKGRASQKTPVRDVMEERV